MKYFKTAVINKIRLVVVVYEIVAPYRLNYDDNYNNEKRVLSFVSFIASFVSRVSLLL